MMKQYVLAIMKGQQKGIIASMIIAVLLPLSWLYRIGLYAHRRWCSFKGIYKAPKPVISIGNITVGGVGKTPLVIWLARHLQDKGLTPVIVTRGYMPVQAKSSDEGDMLQEQMPQLKVLVGSNRIGHIELSKHTVPADVYIADDAFQHWPLARDLNIVVIDAGNPFGNTCLLPAGILREPLSALKRADIFVLTKKEASRALLTQLETINPKALCVHTRYSLLSPVDVFSKEVLGNDFLKGKKMVGFCAIGDPSSFASSIQESKAKLVQLFTFMDHHLYTQEDLSQMVAFCQAQDIDVLVTTHKDAVKLSLFKSLFKSLRVVYIPVELEIIKGQDAFIQKITTVCRC